jgi:hypothetical protein
MIRTGLTELLLFLAPFALYAAFLAATRSGVLDPKSWPTRHVVVLAIVALVLVIGSFLYLAQFSGAPVGTTYAPAHVENGRLVPGAYK